MSLAQGYAGDGFILEKISLFQESINFRAPSISLRHWPHLPSPIDTILTLINIMSTKNTKNIEH
jgi:hypothetical protein